jgi:hypothetical protein
MPHVTFIHGIANKPPSDDLLRLWRNALTDGSEPVPLGDLGVTSSMVYWADLLYEKPETDLSAYEGVLENTAEAVDAAGEASPPIARMPEEAVFIERLREHLTTLTDTEIESAPPVPAVPDGALERVPLPWFLKKRIMNTFLRDVHHYLFDISYAPPGGTPVPIQQAIRKRFVKALTLPVVTRPHIIVSHSMGTIIAYDCLKRVSECASVDGLITLGSPLGLDEVQDKLQPGWSRADGFPAAKLVGRWINAFDRLDPVCGFDPSLGDDYRRSTVPAIEDLAVQNEGNWRHSVSKYLRQPDVGRALRKMLGV